FDKLPFWRDAGLARHRRDQPPRLGSPPPRGALSHGPPPCSPWPAVGVFDEKHPVPPRLSQEHWQNPIPRPLHQTPKKDDHHTASPHFQQSNRILVEHSSVSWK